MLDWTPNSLSWRSIALSDFHPFGVSMEEAEAAEATINEV
jgi:hypothetical protein